MRRGNIIEFFKEIKQKMFSEIFVYFEKPLKIIYLFFLIAFYTAIKSNTKKNLKN